jgi:hypothetical protein
MYVACGSARENSLTNKRGTSDWPGVAPKGFDSSPLTRRPKASPDANRCFP